MANPRRTATIMSSVSAIEADPGPMVPHYAIPLDRPALYRFSVGDTSTVDHDRVLGCNGGTSGRWLLVGAYPRPETAGTDLTDADATITVADGRWRRLPAATLGANRQCTLSTTGALIGDEITISRFDKTANTYAIVNGGVGAGTLITMPASQSWWATCNFDGANWLLKSAGQMP